MESVNNQFLLSRIMESQYDYELDKVIGNINRSHAKKVLIQLPDGLKIDATEIADEIEKATKAEVFIWAEA